MYNVEALRGKGGQKVMGVEKAAGQGPGKVS
jgi:hypothetical protein